MREARHTIRNVFSRIIKMGSLKLRGRARLLACGENGVLVDILEKNIQFLISL